MMRLAFSSFVVASAQVSWEDWKQTYGRVYNGDEEVARKAVFESNVQYIQAENAKGNSHTLAVNKFADLTKEEFIAQYTGLSEPLGFGTEMGTHEETGDVEDSVDWVSRGAVNPVKDQGQCGSCWAFSTVGTLESAYQIATGNLYSLAEQQLVDCDRSDSGCGGGWPHTAFDSYYARNKGVCSESSYRYTARAGSCRDSSCSVQLQAGTVTGHINVGRSSSGLKSAVAQQPISVTVDAGEMQFYANGVVHHSCSGQINHAVITVGYGSDNGDDYFKIRNSWGGRWGESGYIRLAQQGGSQGTACLYQYAPVYPSLSTSDVAV